LDFGITELRDIKMQSSFERVLRHKAIFEA
jgi:hypothetical protein